MKKFYQLLVLAATTIFVLPSFAAIYGLTVYNNFTAKPPLDVATTFEWCDGNGYKLNLTLTQGANHLIYWDDPNRSNNCGGFKLPYIGIVTLRNQNSTATIKEIIDSSGNIEITKHCSATGNLVCGNIETNIVGSRVTVNLKLNG